MRNPWILESRILGGIDGEVCMKMGCGIVVGERECDVYAYRVLSWGLGVWFVGSWLD